MPLLFSNIEQGCAELPSPCSECSWPLSAIPFRSAFLGTEDETEKVTHYPFIVLHWPLEHKQEAGKGNQLWSTVAQHNPDAGTG